MIPSLSKLSVLAFVLGTIVLPARAADRPVQIGDQVAKMTFKDIRYLPRSLEDFKGRKAFVLVFTNTTCPVVANPNQCLDSTTNQMRAVVRPTAGQVFFTEVMADPKAVADATGEWLELLAAADVDLNGTVLTVGTSSKVLSAPGCLHVATGSYAVNGEGFPNTFPRDPTGTGIWKTVDGGETWTNTTWLPSGATN